MTSGIWNLSIRFDSATRCAIRLREIAASPFWRSVVMTSTSPVSARACEIFSETVLRVAMAIWWAWVRSRISSIRSASLSTSLLANKAWATSNSSLARATTRLRGAAPRSARRSASSIRTVFSTSPMSLRRMSSMSARSRSLSAPSPSRKKPSIVANNARRPAIVVSRARSSMALRLGAAWESGFEFDFLAMPVRRLGRSRDSWPRLGTPSCSRSAGTRSPVPPTASDENG